MTNSIYDFEAERINQEKESLAKYKGKVLLIVNVASKCGFTPQYKGLEELYKKFQARGFEILGFPCNQFAGQEPSSNQEIQQFCELNYGVTFPMFAKIDVNGENAHALYKFLKSECKGILGTELVKWNFTKFLISKDGTVLDRFAPSTSPDKLENEIESALG
jgi:glutathione peroxidase